MSSLDLLRGLVIVVMALDHVRDSFMLGAMQDPTADPNVGPPIERRTMTSPSGVVTTDYRYSDDTKVVTVGDAGITTTTQYAADPRYGWGGEYAKSQTITNGDKTITITHVRTADPGASLENESDTISIGPTDDAWTQPARRSDGSQIGRRPWMASPVTWSGAH